MRAHSCVLNKVVTSNLVLLITPLALILLLRDEIGFPIAECDSEGEFVITKPSNTGGLVSTATVAEQVSSVVMIRGGPTRYLD